MNQVLEKGDIVALKNGKRVEIQSVRMDGDRLIRFDYLDRTEASPMRRTAYPSELLQILIKHPKQSPDPKEVRHYDAKEAVQKVVVVKKEEGYSLDGQPQGDAQIDEALPITSGLKTTNEAVVTKAKPVVTRIKRANVK